MEMILRSVEVSTNEMISPFLKAFMIDVTLVSESKSRMEQPVTRLEEFFKWDGMKISLQNAAVSQ